MPQEPRELSNQGHEDLLGTAEQLLRLNPPGKEPSKQQPPPQPQHISSDSVSLRNALLPSAMLQGRELMWREGEPAAGKVAFALSICIPLLLQMHTFTI